MRRVLLFLALLGALMATAQTQAADADRRAHFTWGAEFGSSIDLSAHDMSSIDFNANFGMRWRWFSLLGAGAGANIMVSNSCRTYPLFAVLRTSFSDGRPRLVFLDVRGGVALNYLNDKEQSGGYASVGVGFNLAGGKKFQSYIMAGYTFVGRKDINDETGFQPFDNLHYAGIRLGVRF